MLAGVLLPLVAGGIQVAGRPKVPSVHAKMAVCDAIVSVFNIGQLSPVSPVQLSSVRVLLGLPGRFCYKFPFYFFTVSRCYLLIDSVLDDSN